jgi:hypothetical protein
VIRVAYGVEGRHTTTLPYNLSSRGSPSVRSQVSTRVGQALPARGTFPRQRRRGCSPQRGRVVGAGHGGGDLRQLWGRPYRTAVTILK